MDEPSLLDYLKEKLTLKALFRQQPADILSETAVKDDVEKNIEERSEEHSRRNQFIGGVPWRSILAVGLALVGQRNFEPVQSDPVMGIVFYFAAFCMLIYALWKNEWQTARCPRGVEISAVGQSSVRKSPLYALVPLLIITYIAFSNNQFNAFNILLWIITFAAAMAAFWQHEPQSGVIPLRDRFARFARQPEVKIRFSYWGLLVFAVFCLSAYFHLNQLDTIPLDMTSDHAEKILDVQDVLNGSSPIFFTRNAGREPIQFYLTAFLVKVVGMDLNFTTLKFGMALAFLLSLVYVYRLGKEVGNRWTGLFSMLLLGMAAWTNILARVGMRLVLTPVFVAPVLFYLLRGLRTQRRNDLILAGALLGLGLMGYSAFRIMPFVVVLCVLIYLVRLKNQAAFSRILADFGILVLFAVITALPLLRFALQYPDLIGMRTLTRMTGVEQPINGPVFMVFMKNLWNAIVMPFWRDGNTWVISVTERPALDLVSAVLYLLGTVLLIFSWVKHRDWQYLFLLHSIPVLMLPSILALAFPIENPSLSRAGGAVIPIILMCAIALERLLSSLWKYSKTRSGKLGVILAGLLLVFLSARQNFDLVFNQYNTQYINSTWNTRQMGGIARNYIGSIGSEDTVYVVAKAHWVDTRLVAMNAGYIGKDYQIWPEDLSATLEEPRSKLFFVKTDDEVGLAALKAVYPEGIMELHTARAPGRDFFTYFVPEKSTER